METSFYVIFLFLLVYTCSTEIAADGYVWVDVPSGGGLVEYNLLRKSKRGIICTYYNCKQSNCVLLLSFQASIMINLWKLWPLDS